MRLSLRSALSRSERLSGRLRSSQLLTEADVAAMSDEEITSRLLDFAKKVGGVEELFKAMDCQPSAALVQMLRDAEREAGT